MKSGGFEALFLLIWKKLWRILMKRRWRWRSGPVSAPFLDEAWDSQKRCWTTYTRRNALDSYVNLSIALWLLFLTLLMTGALAKRCFSSLKLKKTYLRSTLRQERLSGLAQISIEQEVRRSLDLEKIGNGNKCCHQGHKVVLLKGWMTVHKVHPQREKKITAATSKQWVQIYKY